jgi:hypothetical protein
MVAQVVVEREVHLVVQLAWALQILVEVAVAALLQGDQFTVEIMAAQGV